MNKKVIDPKIAALIVIAVGIIVAIVIYYTQAGVNFYPSKLSRNEFLAVGFFFAVAAFLVFREFVAWYFKINRIVELLEQIEENTRLVDNEINQD